MKTRSFALVLALAAGAATATGALANTPGKKAATGHAATTPAAGAAPSPGSAAPGTIGSSEACQAAVWPYIPAHCMRNADPGRLSRPVRIIRLEAALPKAAGPVRP